MSTCASCGTSLPDGARFCTDCGAATSPPDRTPAGSARQAEELPQARLVECESCGAGNAASRALCARCNAPLRDEVPGGDALPADIDGPGPSADRPATRGLDGSPVLLSLVILAGLLMAGALLALVTSRVTNRDEDQVPEGVPLQVLESSGAVDGAPAELVVDGDPATAWTTPADGGVGAILVLGLPEAQEVRRVLLWNGDGGSGGGRVASLTIEVADRQFRVEVLDTDGPQAIDLPEGLVAGEVRLEVEEVVPDDADGVTISEVVVETNPA